MFDADACPGRRPVSGVPAGTLTGYPDLSQDSCSRRDCWRAVLGLPDSARRRALAGRTAGALNCRGDAAAHDLDRPARRARANGAQPRPSGQAARLRIGRGGVPDRAAAPARGRPTARKRSSPCCCSRRRSCSSSRAASSSSSRCPAGCSGCRARDRSGCPSWPGSPAKPAGTAAERAGPCSGALRRSVGSLPEVAGIALPFRVLTPGFLGLTAFAAFACLVLVGFGLIAPHSRSRWAERPVRS